MSKHDYHDPHHGLRETYADLETERLERDAIEKAAQWLTRTQADGLARIRDRGPLAWCEHRGRAGGAISRMFDRMARDRLCTRAPHEITDFGRAVLARYEQAHGKRR